MSSSTVIPIAPRRSARKRDAILDAAELQFLSRGYVGTSMDDVALAATVSKQTVYSHFGNKEGLFLALIAHLTGEAGDRVHTLPDAAPATIDDLHEVLVGYADRQLRIAMEPRLLRLRRLVIGEVERFPELAAKLYDDGPARAITSLADLLTASAASGALELGSLTAQEAGERLNWLIMGGPLHRAMLLGDRARLSSAQRRRHASDAVGVFLRSLPKPAP